MGSIASCVSNVMYIIEKLTLYLACIGLLCCLVLTISVTLGMGIGLGYNYCFVNMKTKFKYKLAEDDQLRRSPEQPDIITSKPDNRDPRVLREYLRYNNNTGNGTAMDYHPTFPDSESFNGTESTVKTTVDAPTNDQVTEVTENSHETNSRTGSGIRTTNSSSNTTEDETEIIDGTAEPTPEPSIVNKEQSKSSPSSRKVKKLVIPISGLDLISLLSKLRAENRNYSLQIVTT